MAADAGTSSSAVSNVVGQLRELLQKAREIKENSTVEPALSASDLGPSVSVICREAFGTVPSKQRQAVFESAFRKVFYEILRSNDIREPRFVDIWNLLDIAIIFCEVDNHEAATEFSIHTVWTVIEELIESQTTDSCRIVFDYLESRRERLLQKHFAKTHAVILRTCNDLLRRLSRAEDPAFCGRVFFFLFRVSPLGDHSSANLRGEFHTDNITTFEDDLDVTPTDAVEDVESMQIDAHSHPTEASEQPKEGEPNSNLTTSVTALDAENSDIKKLYASFWRLQQDFSRPTRLFEDEHFETFRRGMESTLTKFATTSTVVQTRSSGDEPRGVKRKLGDEGRTQYHGTYNPKYLTSRELFELELSDISFQRHILVQALIIIEFLMSLTETANAKTKVDLEGVSKPNKSVLYAYTLSQEKESTLKDIKDKIAKYLVQQDRGNFYFRMVETVLSRDKNWIQWKREQCPPIFREAVSTEEYARAKSNARSITAVRRLKNTPTGAIDLAFLFDADKAKGLDSLRGSSRNAAPTISDLIKSMETDELDMEMATDEEIPILRTRKDNKSWRALRIAARTRLADLDKLVKPDTPLKEALMPSEVTEVPEGTPKLEQQNGAEVSVPEISTTEVDTNAIVADSGATEIQVI